MSTLGEAADVTIDSVLANSRERERETWRDSLAIDMLLSAVSVLVVVQPSSEVPGGLMNYPVYLRLEIHILDSLVLRYG
jgi:hypothetical protein